MAGPLYGRDMERLAQARQREGLLLQRQHHEKDGICVSCGRVSPCDDYTAGAELAARYARFLAAEPDPATPPNLLLRPYVSALAGFPNGGRW